MAAARGAWHSGAGDPWAGAVSISGAKIDAMQKIRNLRCETLVLLTMPVVLCAASAQSSAPANPQSTITATSTLVMVPTLVKSSSGEVFQALHASDFMVTDNGVPQRVTIEDTEHQPLSIVVLMQTGGAASRNFPDYAKLGTMLGYLTANSKFLVSMVTFDSRPEDQWDFTPYLEDLNDGFTHPREGDRGAAVLDAVSYAIGLFEQQPVAARHILLLISQTHDDGSKTKTEEIIHRLGENNITIECLTFSPEKDWLKDQFTKPHGATPPYKFAPDQPPVIDTFDLSTPLLMALNAMRTNASREVAALSGGESLPFGSKAEIERQLAVLANHFAETYTLSFHPTSDQPGFHSLEVRLRGRPDAVVSARSSYWSVNTSQP
jgi:VWFA-related protein